VEDGHEVVALVRTTKKAEAVEATGVRVAFADALNSEELTAAIKRAEPEVIIHHLTALTGTGNFKQLDEEFALTNRFRTEVTDTIARGCSHGGNASLHCARLLWMAVRPRGRTGQVRR
jgi:nucleoside-diphosphate-sugar epimerase